MSAEVLHMPEDGRRTLPHNLEAEKALLGAVFVNRNAWERVAFLKPDRFALAQHGRIFAACEAMFLGGKIPDPVTLARYFEQEQSLAEIGGQKYLFELAQSAATPINAGEYAKLIDDLYLRRQLIAAGQAMIDRAFDAAVDTTAATIRAEAESGLFDLFDCRAEGEPISAKDVGDRALEGIDRAIKRGDSGGIKTGLIDLDEATGGMFPGEVTVLAGRPAMGKTALAIQVAMQAARRHVETEGREGAASAFFSMEMPADQLLLRDMAPRAGVKVQNVRLGRVGSAEFDALFRATEDMRGLPLWIDDRSGLDVMQIWAAAKALKRRHGIGLVLIDYLQLVEGSGENRTAVVTDVTRKLKAMARSLDLHVLALSQLSRQVENRDDKRPYLSDLRESGSIEQDADVVMFLYRDDYYLAKQEPKQKDNEAEGAFVDRLNAYYGRLNKCRGLAEIIVAKQRQGPTPTVTARFDADRMTFHNLARDQEQEAML